MFNQKYTLEVISHHQQFQNKNLRKYYVDGIETVGAWGDEPFEIKFKNNTGSKVQVKISLDGTDVLTGKPATTEISKDMWVVGAYDTIKLKAWTETSNGGSAFVFTSANNSVAAHTHGDLSCRGIIVAAVYVEGCVEPTPIRIDHYHQNYPYYPWYVYPTYVGDYILGNQYYNVTCTNDANNDFSFNESNLSFNSCGISNCANSSKHLESLVSVGAGEHVDQKITYVAGLSKPIFTETVRVKFMWWDDLVVRLKESQSVEPHASGFPGDKNKIMSIGDTPKVESFRRSFQKEAAVPAYSRI